MSHDFSTVREYTLAKGGRLLLAPTSARDLVVIEGSVYGGPNMLPRERAVLPALAASLLDAGTTKRSKAALREALAAKGISLSFSAAGDRTLFSGQCFPEDLQALLKTVVECLSQASFPEAEVKNAKTLAHGALAEEKSKTRARAERALAALIYDEGHPNHLRSIEADERGVQSLRRADFQKFRTQLGRGGLIVSIAGDVTPTVAKAAVEKAFAPLSKGTETPSPKTLNTKVPGARETLVPIADKANIDVVMGVSLPVTLAHPLYHPLLLVVDALGGGFTSHLMQTIRDRDGLTYGVYARLSGVRADTDGYLKINASFTPDRYAESVQKLRDEIALFLSEGMTDVVLEETKARMIGSYLVALATTESMATALHSLGIQGQPLSYLGEYTDILRRITLAEARAAAALIDVDKLALAASGTFKKK